MLLNIYLLTYLIQFSTFDLCLTGLVLTITAFRLGLPPQKATLRGRGS